MDTVKEIVVGVAPDEQKPRVDDERLALLISAHAADAAVEMTEDEKLLALDLLDERARNSALKLVLEAMEKRAEGFHRTIAGMRSHLDCKLVRVSNGLADQWLAGRTNDCAKLSFVWGEPDEFGVYNPIMTKDESNNPVTLLVEAMGSAGLVFNKALSSLQEMLGVDADLAEVGGATKIETVKEG